MELFDLVAGGAWWIGLPMAFALGMALGISPFGWPVLALVTGARSVSGPAEPERRVSGVRASLHQRVGLTVTAMALAVVLVYALLGFATDRLDDVLRVGVGSVAGILYAVIAVAAMAGGLTLLFRPSMLCHVPSATRGRRARGPVVGFLLGVPLAVANCPSCAVVITGVALAAGTTGSTAYAVGAMTMLGLGHAAALVLASALLVRPFEVGARLSDTVRRTGAALLVGVGAWYAFQAWRYGLTVQAPLY